LPTIYLDIFKLFLMNVYLFISEGQENLHEKFREDIEQAPVNRIERHQNLPSLLSTSREGI
jgi:hypothetical protein